MLTTFDRLPDGSPVHRLVLGRAPGAELHVLTLGAAVQRLDVTGGDGVRRDVALGYADAASYLRGGDYLGAVVGRSANRIAHGAVRIDDRDARLTTNDRGHHLHGGADGFDARVWSVVEHDDTVAVLRLESPDGDQGYPGRVVAEARYEVDGDRVDLTLSATTDAPTLVALTSHLYLNLAGAEAGGGVDDHLLEVPAPRYTPVDATGIPTGELAPVDGTPFDLRGGVRVGDACRAAHPQTRAAQGLDHNLVLDPAHDGGSRPVAVLTCPATRTRVVVGSDQPGLQLYTGNFLDGTTASRTGRLVRQGDGIALEPQVFPDSPHHEGEAGWPSATLRPGETYRSQISWTFSPTR